MTEINAILEEKHLSYLTDSFLPEQGNLNTVIFLRNEGGEKLVLRIFRGDKRDEIQSYLDNSYDVMGLKKYGARLKYRDMGEQVRFMFNLKAKGIPVPRIIDHDSDWLLMEMFNGRPLKDRLPKLKEEKSKLIVRNVLSAHMDVHKKGECLWDRWGANELISAKGSVNFIDFDIDLDWPDEVPHKIKASFDLSIMVRACVQFSANKKIAAETIVGAINGNKNFSQIYDMDALRDFFRGQILYYNDAYCLNLHSSPEDKEMHLRINDTIGQISNDIYNHGKKVVSKKDLRDLSL